MRGDNQERIDPALVTRLSRYWEIPNAAEVIDEFGNDLVRAVDAVLTRQLETGTVVRTTKQRYFMYVVRKRFQERREYLKPPQHFSEPGPAPEPEPEREPEPVAQEEPGSRDIWDSDEWAARVQTWRRNLSSTD
ncbi:MAG: hypothetical protein WD645_05765 [Dehalococcoidia bacterium]